MQPFLYIVRHGQTALNAENRLQGHVDAPLNEQGKAHAAYLSAYFSTRRLREIWSSPLQRARDTAVAIAHPHGLPLTIDHRLIELNYGDIDGMTMEEAAQRSNFGDRDLDRMTYRPPGGETYLEMLARLGPVMAEKRAEPALIVAHQGVMRMICAYFEVMPPQAAAMQNFGHQSIITLFRDTNDKVNGHIQELNEHETL